MNNFSSFNRELFFNEPENTYWHFIVFTLEFIFLSVDTFSIFFLLQDTSYANVLHVMVCWWRQIILQSSSKSSICLSMTTHLELFLVQFLAFKRGGSHFGPHLVWVLPQPKKPQYVMFVRIKISTLWSCFVHFRATMYNLEILWFTQL